jgi:hypothetical protein
MMVDRWSRPMGHAARDYRWQALSQVDCRHVIHALRRKPHGALDRVPGLARSQPPDGGLDFDPLW